MFTVWFTGGEAERRVALADSLAEELRKQDLRVEVLKEAELRRDLFPELSASDGDADRLAGRVSWLADLLQRSGIVTLISASCSPERTEAIVGGMHPHLLQVNCGTASESNGRNVVHRCLEGEPVERSVKEIVDILAEKGLISPEFHDNHDEREVRRRLRDLGYL